MKKSEFFNGANNECKPLNNNKELLEFYKNPVNWNSLVVPITRRCKPRFLNENYNIFSYLEKPYENEVAEQDRPEVLVCHDLADNYRGDR